MHFSIKSELREINIRQEISIKASSIIRKLHFECKEKYLSKEFEQSSKRRRRRNKKSLEIALKHFLFFIHKCLNRKKEGKKSLLYSDWIIHSPIIMLKVHSSRLLYQQSKKNECEWKVDDIFSIRNRKWKRKKKKFVAQTS